jgi:hypothetical protein
MPAGSKRNIALPLVPTLKTDIASSKYYFYKNVKMNRLIIFFSFTLILSGCTVLNILTFKKIAKLSFDNELLNPDYQFYFPNPNKDSVIFKIKESSN